MSTRQAFMPGFWRGLTAPGKGVVVFLRKPSLLLWCVLPLSVAFVVDSLLVTALLPRIRARVDAAIPDQGWYWIAADWAAQAILTIGVVVGAVLVFTAIYFAVAGPFNELLSERIERMHGTATGEGSGLSLFGAVLDGVRQAGILAVLGLPALLFSLIPVFGFLVFALWSSVLLGFSFFEIPLSRRGIPFAEKRAVARAHAGAVIGLGLSVFLFCMIPFFQIIFMPAFVAGGTLLYVDMLKRQPAPAPVPPRDR